MVAEFFCEHCQRLLRGGRGQPVGIEVDGAGADRIGPSSPRHGAGRQQHDLRKVAEIPSRPSVDQLRQQRRLCIQPQGLCGSPADRVIDGPALEQLLPLGQQQVQQRGSTGGADHADSSQLQRGGGTTAEQGKQLLTCDHTSLA